MTDLTTRIAALEAAGSWRTVPVEPTEAMLEAGADNLFASASENSADEARIIWSAMLSAAPQPGGDALPIIREQQAEIARLKDELDTWQSVFPDIVPDRVLPDRSLLEAEIARLRDVFRLAVDVDAALFLSAEYKPETTVGEFFKKAKPVAALRAYFFDNQDTLPALNERTDA